MKKPKPIPNLEITDAASEGWGLGRHEGQVVLVPGTMPGDVVNALGIRKRKGALEAKLEALLKASAQRVEPPCQHFGHCGGCKWQMMDYTAQLHYKQKQTEDALRRIGGLELPEIRPILGCAAPYGYRNKVEFTFSDNRWMTREEIATGQRLDPNTLGFHVPGFYDKVLEISHCYLHQDRLNALRNELLRFTREQSVPFYNVKTHLGFLRNLVFRTSEATGEVLVLLIVAEENQAFVELIFNYLSQKFEFVTDWVWIVNTKLNDQYTDLPYNVWKGKGYITEVLGGKQFRISPVSFFQTNSTQAERLYAVARDFLGGPAGTLYDLYCGTGTIGIYCADLAERIVGLEYVPQSVTDAHLNARINGLEDRSRFYAGDIQHLLNADFVTQNGQPDALITDPPRNGMDEPVVRRLLEIRPKTIVYVSCKPSTQARDLALLKEAYAITAVQPVDMFPQTTHVENVVRLERRG